MNSKKNPKCPYEHGNIKNIREIEQNIQKDFSKDMSYGDYLRLNELLELQSPQTEQHDEMLFIIIHQSSELWIKLISHELKSAMNYIKIEDFNNALKKLTRISRIQEQLIQSWSILSTLTPVDYVKFRDGLGSSSGFQSYGYREIEFMLGNKNLEMLEVHKHDKKIYNELKEISSKPSIYELILQKIAKYYPINKSVLHLDFNQPYRPHDSVLNAWKNIYQNPEKNWNLYYAGEKLTDIEDTFQTWRFRHLSTVTRIIGNKTGTGGSSGVNFLKKALDIRFFPELFDMRTEL